tara:strand:- start:83 stop:490 length:408 start_codon:yes stop_codon:yes gene_type:complete
MEINERRALLIVSNNPDESLDYISGLQGALIAMDNKQPTVISIHYVPDRFIITAASFSNYLEALSEQTWKNLEELITTVLGDLSNQLVARWICVKGSASKGAESEIRAHEVLIEDRQPEWDNPSLLLRSEKFKDH